MSKPTKELLRFISEDQKLASFSGRISKRTASYTPDMEKISNALKRMGTKAPMSKSRQPHKGLILPSQVNEQPTDSRLKKAIKQGNSMCKKLREAEGGSLSAEDAARELKISTVAIINRYKKGLLVAWKEECQNAYRFPVWQFKDGKVLDGLEDVLKELNRAKQLDDFGRMLFFLSTSQFLEDKRPLDCLRDGDTSNVMLLAENYGQ